MVPKGWERQPIKELCESIIDCVNKTAKHVDYITPYKMIRTTNVRHGKVDTENVRYVDEDVYKKWIRRGAPQDGDVIFTREAPVGEVGVLEDSTGIFLGQRTMMYRVDPKIADNRFVFYSLMSGYCQKQIEDFSNGGTVAHMRVPDCGEIIINFPPLPEQQKIAKILSTWDKAISSTERLIDNSTQRKKALMQQLLTGKKRLAGFNEEWISEPLEKVVGKIYGGGTPSKNVPEYWDGDIPWVTVKDLIATKIDGAQQYINKSGLENSSANMVPAGTVIIATRMALGKAVIASCDVAINQDLKAITGSPKIDSVFLHYWLLLQAKVIEKLGTGSTVKGVQLETIKSLRMHIPSSIQEQQKIATVLTNADQEIELLEQQLADLQQEKKALMQVLLTGKKRVVVDGEVA